MTRIHVVFSLGMTAIVLAFFASTIHSCQDRPPQPPPTDKAQCFDSVQYVHAKCVGVASKYTGDENTKRVLGCTREIEPYLDRCFTLGEPDPGETDAGE